MQHERAPPRHRLPKSIRIRTRQESAPVGDRLEPLCGLAVFTSSNTAHGRSYAGGRPRHTVNSSGFHAYQVHAICRCGGCPRQRENGLRESPALGLASLALPPQACPDQIAHHVVQESAAAHRIVKFVGLALPGGRKNFPDVGGDLFPIALRIQAANEGKSCSPTIGSGYLCIADSSTDRDNARHSVPETRTDGSSIHSIAVVLGLRGFASVKFGRGLDRLEHPDCGKQKSFSAVTVCGNGRLGDEGGGLAEHAPRRRYGRTLRQHIFAGHLVQWRRPMCPGWWPPRAESAIPRTPSRHRPGPI